MEIKRDFSNNYSEFSGHEVYDPLLDPSEPHDSNCPAPAYIYAMVIEKIADQDDTMISEGQGMMFGSHATRYKLQVRKSM